MCAVNAWETARVPPRFRASVTSRAVARLVDSVGQPARFVSVTAAPLGRGAVAVWHLVGVDGYDTSRSEPARGCSSAGRALRSQCRGQGFDPPQLHHLVFVGWHAFG